MGRLVNAPAADRAPAPLAAVAAKPHPAVPLAAARKTPDAPFRARLPAAGRTRAFKVPAVRRFRLRNRLPVILAESHKLPLVSMDLVVKTGSSANPKDKPGLASLVANMLDEGTKRRSATQIAGEVAQLGARLLTYATWDASAVSLATMTENLDRAAPIWADVLLAPEFAEDELGRVVDNLLSALAQRKDHPPVVANQVFARALWGDAHPFAWPDLGTKASLPRLSRAEVRSFYDTYYAPNNAVLVISGDITEKEVRAKLEPLLASWKPKKVPPVRVPKVDAPDKPRIVLVDKPDAPQSSVRLGLPAIARKSPDYYRALVANHILGGTFKRLTMNLRETRGWTYGVYSHFDARRAEGSWSVAGEFVAAHTADAIAEIGKEIEKLRADEVPSKELDETKDEIIGAFPARFATAAQLASQMAALAVYDLPPSELDGFVAKIAAVDKEAVKRMATKYMRPDNLLAVVVGDRARLERSLGKLAPLERRDFDGNLIEPAK
jgi:zinc protease